MRRADFGGEIPQQPRYSPDLAVAQRVVQPHRLGLIRLVITGVGRITLPAPQAEQRYEQAQPFDGRFPDRGQRFPESARGRSGLAVAFQQAGNVQGVRGHLGGIVRDRGLTPVVTGDGDGPRQVADRLERLDLQGRQQRGAVGSPPLRQKLEGLSPLAGG